MKKWCVDDVMTTAVVSVPETAPYRAVVDLLVANRFSAVPVADVFHRVSGVVSEADLLRKIEYAGDEEPRMFDGRRRRADRAKAGGRTAAEIMSTPPVVVPSGTPLAAAARMMDDEGVKRLPVVDDLGRLIGIVSRGDLLKVHLRPDDEIAADVREVLDSLLPERAGSVRAQVDDGVVTLTGRVERRTTTVVADRLIRQIGGVAEVRDKLGYDVDDSAVLGDGMPFGVA
ncbi:CBS domain-containing protein [Jidongwangia harbinensis]|uniref:CBS domain-containing protein n=1 Tax=Jidongwangia harbinensis TaxID=2878561 RepID=UPI001CD9ACF4|nr:CBS domain-containing protein [Jidongwangia harbinensis]MCA2219192.1 CBS domain-containing protein [Jidongwangia harbinensis]